MMDEDSGLVDSHRSCSLDDVGLTGYRAVVTVNPDGCEHLALACQAALGDPGVLIDPRCSEVAHEQLGPLPVDVVQRVAISSRRDD